MSFIINRSHISARKQLLHRLSHEHDDCEHTQHGAEWDKNTLSPRHSEAERITPMPRKKSTRREDEGGEHQPEGDEHNSGNGQASPATTW